MSLSIIVSHVGTDFDGFASMVLAQKLYDGAELVFPGRLGTGVEEFYALHRRFFPVLSLKEALAQEISRIVVVDTRLASRLGPFREHLQNPKIELHIYDHHPPTAEAVRGDQEWVEAVGAAATLLVERCREADVEILPEEATLALIAIHEETGSFRYSSSTPRDLAAAAFLQESGANLEVLNHFLRDPLSRQQRELLEEFLTRGEVVHGASGSLYLTSAERSKSVFGLGLLAARVLEVQGTDAVCAVLGVKGKQNSIAARSQSDAFDMAVWMQHWGGGGHRRAAAASNLDESLAGICEKLRTMAQRGEMRPLLAKDVMSHEVFSLNSSSTVDGAAQALREAGHHAACILDDDGLMVGLVSRGDLGKALDHGLGHAPATSVMTHRVVSVSPETPVEEVRRLVVERSAGTIPVLDGERLVGIVSRTDLLREMYQQAEEESQWRSGIGPSELDLSTTPQPYREWIDVVEDLAHDRRLRLYAVGGFVRDALLGRPTDDLDLVVEGDAIALARDLAQHLGGKLTAHEKYLTATLRFPDGHKLDLATARREVYCRPAALPEVAQSNLKSDLYRRDFTINSLAIRLSTDLRGSVIDFFGGQADLEGQVIRVLHNHSFFDDPTRILRAVRFEQRLGFTIEPHTRQLIKAALEADVLTLTRPERLLEELRLSLAETDPLKVLGRLEQLNVLAGLHPEVRFRGKVKARIERFMEISAEYPDFVEKAEIWRIPLLLLCSELSEQGSKELGARFGWHGLVWPFEFTSTVGRFCRREMRASEIANILDTLPPVSLLLFACLSPHAKFWSRIKLYLDEIRYVTPLLNGEDILEAGVERGPEISHWKQAAFDAQRDGEFHDRAGGLDWLNRSLLAGAAPV